MPIFPDSFGYITDPTRTGPVPMPRLGPPKPKLDYGYNPGDIGYKPSLPRPQPTFPRGTFPPPSPIGPVIPEPPGGFPAVPRTGPVPMPHLGPPAVPRTGPVPMPHLGPTPSPRLDYGYNPGDIGYKPRYLTEGPLASLFSPALRELLAAIAGR